MRLAFFLLVIAASFNTSTHAQQTADLASPANWLERMETAARKLNYTGVFVYQSGNHSETSRITHIIDGGVEREKLEALDGSLREVVRTNDEVKCYLPEQRMLIIERQSRRNTFPRLPAAVSQIAENYQVLKGENSRIAGLDSQQVTLEPRDAFRYGHMLWADAVTGLLLKSRMVNEKNETIEQFVFTQIQIRGVIDKETLKSKLTEKSAGWQIHQSKPIESSTGEDAWNFTIEIPGFKRSANMKRRLHKNRPEVSHIVFSDGMVAISVFIEPLPGKKDLTETGLYSTGAINVYKRVVGDNLLTVLGEVPPQTLKKLGDGVEQRKK